MHVSVDRATLLNSLGHVTGIVARTQSVPILGNVLLKANGDSIAMSCTNVDMSMTAMAAVKVISDGATTVRADTLFSIIKKLPDDADVDMHLSDDKGQLNIKSGRSRFKLGTLDPAEYPDSESHELEHSFDVPCVDLRTMISKTKFAISTEETRYFLCGLFFQRHIDCLRAVSTDGHRLARVDRALPDGAAGIPNIIVPTKTIEAVAKLIGNSESSIKMEVSETKVRFIHDNITITSKLIDGTFPDYERVIPSGNSNTLHVDSRSIAQAVDRVSTVASDKTKGVKFSLTTQLVTLSVNNNDGGFASEEMGADTEYSGKPLDIGFNSDYVREIAKGIDGKARITMSDAAGPAVIHDTADQRVLYVLMPMLIN